MNSKCGRLSVQIKISDFDNIMNLLRMINIDNVFSDLCDDETYMIDIYIRESDKEHLISEIQNRIKEYSNKYNIDLPYRLYYDNNMMKMHNMDFETYISSYKESCVIYEAACISRGELLKHIEEAEYSKINYLKSILDKNQYILPFKDNEFIVSFSSFMNSFSASLFSLDCIELDKKSNILVLGNNRFIYGKIISDIYECNIEVSSIDSYLDKIYKSENNLYDLILVELESFHDIRTRDLLLWSVSHSKNIILSGMRVCDEYYYRRMLSDMDFFPITTNNYMSFIFGSANTDKYKNEINIGY